MTSRAAFYLLLAASVIVVSSWSSARASAPVAQELRDLFDAQDAGDAEVKFIAKSDKRGRILIANKTGEMLDIVIPEAFVGVPVARQQFGGGGGGGGFGGGGGGGQGVGGGGGGLGGGGGGFGGGGGGGQFSIPPETTAKIDVPLLCLDHGLKIPSSSKPYVLVRADEYLASRPEVIQLLAAYGRGDLHRGSAQAAVWNLNSDVSWKDLAAKLDGTVRSLVRNPYFSSEEIRTGMAYASEAVRRASLDPATEDEQAPADESMGNEPEDYADEDGVVEEPAADDASEAADSPATDG